jgi:hypothetical protein
MIATMPQPPRYADADYVSVIVEHGPSTSEQVLFCLYPDGTTYSRDGVPTPKRPDSITRRLDAIATRSRLLRCEADGEADVYHLGSAVGTVSVIYLGTLTLYAGVYNAGGRPIDLDHSARQKPIRAEPDLRGLLRAGVESLSRLLRQDSWRSHGELAGLAVMLPAALDTAGTRIQSAEPREWKRLENLPDEIARLWRAQQRQFGELPDLPRTPDGRLALTVDTDTLAAMYDRNPSDEAHAPCRARTTLGVKCSGGVRSTVVTRGSVGWPPPASERRRRASRHGLSRSVRRHHRSWAQRRAGLSGTRGRDR